MKRVYANLLGMWTDITETGTVADLQNPSVWIEENLSYKDGEYVAECFKYDYVNVQYGGKNYRINPCYIQIVEE